MTQSRIAVFIVLCFLCGIEYSTFAVGQHPIIHVNWKDELQKARAGIKKDPKSAFWHNQAGVAYDALGDPKNAEKELTLASRLDSTKPIYYYVLYGFYQRRGTIAQMREVLLNALENDSANPVGRIELGAVLEKEGDLAESLSEYRLAKLLVAKVKGREYTDPTGTPYDIEYVRRDVDGCIERVAKLIEGHRQGSSDRGPSP